MYQVRTLPLYYVRVARPHTWAGAVDLDEVEDVKDSLWRGCSHITYND